MKKITAFLLALATALALTACGGGNKNVELTVFAAASMQETLTEIGENYKKDHPNVTLTFNFDSSGTLQTQIEEGAVCDIFISAGQKQMNALAEGNYIKEDTRFDLLENKVALAVPEGNPAGINSYDDLKAGLEEIGRASCRATARMPDEIQAAVVLRKKIHPDVTVPDLLML